MYTIILIQVFIPPFTSYTIYILIRWSVLCLFPGSFRFLYWLSSGHYAFPYPYGHLLSIAQSLAFCSISFPFCTYVYYPSITVAFGWVQLNWWDRPLYLNWRDSFSWRYVCCFLIYSFQVTVKTASDRELVKLEYLCARTSTEYSPKRLATRSKYVC